MGITASEFEAAYRAHGQTVLKWARGIMGDRADVEDAAQNAWMEAWRSREAFDGVRPFWAWLRMIVKRACWRMLNPDRKQVPTVSDDVAGSDVVEAALVTEGDAERAADAASLRHAIDTLQVRTAGGWAKTRPAGQAMRDTMHMVLDDMDSAEIEQARGVKRRGVNGLIEKAILALRHRWSVNV